MKKLYKKGFTLVECVVAMALLAVMALMLSMLLTATVNLRNNNVKVEKAIDAQVDKIALDNESDPNRVSEALASNGATDSVDFGGGIKITGGQKVYFSDSPDVQVGKLVFDSVGGGSSLPGEEGDPGGDGEDDDPANKKVYGALPISGNVSISQQSCNENGENYVMVWRVSFTPSTFQDDFSVKVKFPDGSRLISAQNNGGSYKVHNLGRDTIRIEPTSDASVTVDVEFSIPKSKYRYIKNQETGETEEETVEHYFKGSGVGSSAQVSINS